MDSQYIPGSSVVLQNRKQEKAGKFKRQVVLQKLNNPLGIATLVLVALIIAVGTAYTGVVFGAALVAAVIGGTALYCVVAYPEFGVTLLLVMAYMLFELMRIGIPGPLGTLMDGLQGLLLITMVVKQKREDNWAIFKSPITPMVLLWITYNLIEVANPTAESRLAWVYTVRSVAIVQLSYFIFTYNIRTLKFVRFVLKLWLFLAFCGAVYGLKQEYIGFSNAEDAYLHSDPQIASLLFIDGHWRRFSFFSDPVSFSYNMVMPCILCICVMFGKFAKWKKAACGILMILCFMSMLYSGTRGANVLLPAALFLFAILNYNKLVLKFSIVAAVFFAILIVVPTGNTTIKRFQSAFQPGEDMSYKVRKANQKRIQPYILTHPMGGGLGSTGEWGRRFAPGSFLAHFPPDSGYMRIAVENGWLGLILFCTMLFVFMRTGINNYYAIKDPELKTYCLAVTLIVFTYNIANFPQEALVQFPSNILFYLFVALINVIRRLDDEKTANLQAPAFV